MKKKLPVLFLLIGALGFTSCGGSSNGITPGKLPKGGTEITAEEMATKINEIDTTYSNIDGFYCSLNIDDISYKSNVNYTFTSNGKTVEQIGVNEFGLSGKFEAGKNTVKSKNDNKDQTNAYVKMDNFNLKYKYENSVDGVASTSDKTFDLDYSNMAAGAYLTNDNLYIDLSNENTKKLIDDLLNSSTTSIVIPSKFVIQNISSLFGSITMSSYVDGITGSFDFDLTNVDETLVSLKTMFGESVSYQAFGENGFGIAISVSKEKMIELVIDEYVKENHGENVKFEDLSEDEQKTVRQIVDQYNFKSIAASVYFDGDNKVMEFATDIDYSANITINEQFISGTSQNDLTLKLSSSIDLKGREFTFPSDLNEYQAFDLDSFIF